MFNVSKTTVSTQVTQVRKKRKKKKRKKKPTALTLIDWQRSKLKPQDRVHLASSVEARRGSLLPKFTLPLLSFLQSLSFETPW